MNRTQKKAMIFLAVAAVIIALDKFVIQSGYSFSVMLAYAAIIVWLVHLQITNWVPFNFKAVLAPGSQPAPPSFPTRAIEDDSFAAATPLTKVVGIVMAASLITLLWAATRAAM